MKRYYTTQTEFADLWDIISILQVKYDNCKEIPTKMELKKKIQEHEAWFLKKSGLPTLQIITRSKEYSDLYEANYQVFKAVDLAKSDKEGKLISGYQLDQLNVNRNRAKRTLSQKFLLEDPEEIKIRDGKRI